MQRIGTATARADLFGQGKPGFVDGDPIGGFPPTYLNAEWFNGVQEEIINVVEAAGLAPTGADLTQLLQAMRIMSFAGGRTDIPVLGWKATPPVSPAAMDAYIVAVNPTGAWEGKAHAIAVFTGAKWIFSAPMPGVQANFAEAGRFAAIWFDGSQWVRLNGSVIDKLTTFTVSADGNRDFKNLTDCFDYLRRFDIPLDVQVVVRVETNINEPAPVDLSHRDGNQISIYGPTMKGAFPVVADYTGNSAQDEAMLRARFGATITGAASYNIVNVVGTRLREIRDLLFVGKGGDDVEDTCISIGETDLARFGRTGPGGVLLRRVAAHKAGTNISVRQRSDLVYSDLAMSAGSNGFRVANSSYASNFDGHIVAVFNKIGVGCRDGSSFEAQAGTADIQKNTDAGVSTDGNSFARLDSSRITNNGINNLRAFNRSAISAIGAALNGSGSVDVRAFYAAFINAAANTSGFGSSPAAGSVGNSNSFVAT